MKSLLLVLLLLPLSIIAQNKFAYVNVGEVFYKMPEMKDVETKIAAKNETIRKNIETMETEFNTKAKEFEEFQKQSQPDSVLADKQKELQGLQERYRIFAQNSQQELQNEQRALLTPLEEKMMKAIKDVGNELGYTIFNSEAVLHVGSDIIDANPQVKAKLGITN